MANFKKLYLTSGIYVATELIMLSIVIVATSYFHRVGIIRYLGEILMAFTGAGILIGFIAFIAHMNTASENPYFRKMSFCIITGLLMPFVFFFYMLTQMH